MILLGTGSRSFVLCRLGASAPLRLARSLVSRSVPGPAGKRRNRLARKKSASSCDDAPCKLCRTAVLLRRLIYSFALRPKPSHYLSILPLCCPALRLKFSQNSHPAPASSPSSYCATKFLRSVAHIGRRRFHQFIPRFPSIAPNRFHFPFRSGCTINFLSSRVNWIFSFHLCKSVDDCANCPPAFAVSSVGARYIVPSSLADRHAIADTTIWHPLARKKSCHPERSEGPQL